MVRSGIFHHSLSGIELDELKYDETEGEDTCRLSAEGKAEMSIRMIMQDKIA